MTKDQVKSNPYQYTTYEKRRLDSIGFPFPETIPYTPKKSELLRTTPIKVALETPMVIGKVYIRYKKYNELDIITPDVNKRII